MEYTGQEVDPQWIDVEPGEWLILVKVASNFESKNVARYPVVCRVTADTSEAARALSTMNGPNGQKYLCVVFEIILLFGLTEYKAQLCWMENVRVLQRQFCLSCI
jgi:hypothetical protein